jgi:hypothetical protein
LTTITVLGIPWEIFRAPQPPAEIGALHGGCADHMLKEIVLIDSSPEEMLHLLLHELLHVVDGYLSLGMREDTIRRLAYGLNQVFTANKMVCPDLITKKYWTALKEKTA